MRYKIHYSCSSHVGKCRNMNQDNFICDGKYMDDNDEPLTFPLTGTLTGDHPSLITIHNLSLRTIAQNCATNFVRNTT